ncbi:MAG: hypothetical protein LBJ77_00725 [Holosporales bacterium]|nr:hypothetical protein [Holosporales bacterium]
MELKVLGAILMVASSIAAASDSDSQSSDEYDGQINQLLHKHDARVCTDVVKTSAEFAMPLVGAVIGAGVAVTGVYLAAVYSEQHKIWWKAPVVGICTGVGAALEIAEELKLEEEVSCGPNAAIIGAKAIIGGVKGAVLGTIMTMTGRNIAQVCNTGDFWASHPKSLLAAGLTTALGASIGWDMFSSNAVEDLSK